MTDPVVTKVQTETYRIRAPHNWADITIYEPSGPRTGGMQIHSDFGDWAFTWYDHGCKSFKHFILGLAETEEYLVNKLTKGNLDPDPEATTKALQEMLEKAVKDGELSENLRVAFLEELDAAGGVPDDYDEFHDLVERAIIDCTHSLKHEEALNKLLVNDYPNLPWREQPSVDCCQFFQKIFVPYFVPAIKAELET